MTKSDWASLLITCIVSLAVLTWVILGTDLNADADTQAFGIVFVTPVAGLVILGLLWTIGKLLIEGYRALPCDIGD